MRYARLKAFVLSFLFTMALLMPVAAVVTWRSAEQRQQAWEAAASPASSSRGQANANHRMTLLLCVVGQEQIGFLLLRLDATQDTVWLDAIPQESVVLAEGGSELLAESYRAAGPARAAQRLTETLGVEIDRYLACSPALLGDLTEKVGSVRYALSGAMTAEQQALLGLTEAIQESELEKAEEFLQTVNNDRPDTITPVEVAKARAAVWDALLRQRIENLAQRLPAALRTYSAEVLTDLSATDLYRLEETLGYLAQAEILKVESGILPGDWAPATGRYEFNENTVAYVQSRFNMAASGAASASGSAP